MCICMSGSDGVLGGHKGLYCFGRNVPTSSSLLLVLPAFGLQLGLQTGERGKGPQFSSGRSEQVLRARSLLLCFYLMDRSRVDLDPLHGVPCFPFYRQRESMGYNGGKEKNEREKKAFRIVGSFFSFMRVPLIL